MEANVILPAIAAVSVVLLIIEKIYYKLRIKFPITVNCWFCNSNTSVPYNSSNSWYCPHCDQYNGFWRDGSYNRILQDQFNEKLNGGSWCSKIKQKRFNSNGLCRFCNINLELKVQQLAQFVPFNKDNYDEEVQQYSDKLERVYRLCTRCQVVLDITLKDKYKTLVTDQQYSFKSTFNKPTIQPKQKVRHPAYLGLSTLLSLGLLLSAVPYQWSTHLVTNYPLPVYVLQLVTLAKQYFPNGVQSSVFLALGVVVHVFDCAFTRDMASLVNLLLWVIILSLTYIPVQIDNLVPTILMVASVIFFITSMAECRTQKTKSVATVKPVQLHKLDGKTNVLKKNTNAVKEETKSSVENAESSNYSVSDPNYPHPVPSPASEVVPDDFGLGKLNMSSRRVTRSQTKHFQTKMYGSYSPTDIFRPRTVNLSPPKLHLDKSFDYQTPPTRSSSQSSGFVSLSNQKFIDETRSPSVVAEDLDSISQFGGNGLTPYPSSPLSSPISFSHPYAMPFAQYPPSYSIMHFTHPSFNRFYQYSQMSPYQPSLNLSSISMQNHAEKGWFQLVKSVLFSSLFLFLITSNVAILWKVFGEDYFNTKT